MKQTFSTSWQNSTQVRKQRKFRHNAPLHVLGKFVTVNLSKELRSKHNQRNIRIKKGDKVKILRGGHKGKTGKIERVSLKHTKVYVTGIELIKRDGTKTLIPLEPTNVQIVELNTGDKKRLHGDKNGKKSP